MQSPRALGQEREGESATMTHVIHEGWMVLTLGFQFLEDVSPQQRMSSCSAPWKARPPLRTKKKIGRNSPGPHRAMLRYLWCSPQAVRVGKWLDSSGLAVETKSTYPTHTPPPQEGSFAL